MKENLKKQDNEPSVKISLTAITPGLVNATCADRSKIGDVGEEKDILQCLRDKGIDLENSVGQMLNICGTEVRYTGSWHQFLKACMDSPWIIKQNLQRQHSCENSKKTRANESGESHAEEIHIRTKEPCSLRKYPK